MSHDFKFALGMTCNACVGTAETVIENCKANTKITRSHVDLISKTATITVEDDTRTRDTLCKMFISEFDDVGLTCEELADEPPHASHTFKFALGMTCNGCVGTAETVIDNCKAQTKITSSKIDLISKTATINIIDDPRPRDEIRRMFINEFDDVGLTCEEIVEETVLIEVTDPATPPPPSKVTLDQNKKKRTLRNHLIKGTIGLVVGAALMALMASGLSIPMVAMYVLVGVSSLLTLALGIESYKNGAKKLFKARSLTMDTLFTVSTLTVIGTSIAHLFVHSMPMMLEAGVLIFAFKHFGNAIEEAIKNKITAPLSLEERAVKKVLRKNKDNSDYTLIDSKDIAVGDLIRILCEEDEDVALPVNGVLELDEDETWLYKTIKDGSTTPRRMKNGKRVCAGMKIPKKKDKYGVNYIDIRVTQTLQNSHIAELLKKSAEMQQDKAPIEGTANKILKYFIPAVFAVAAVAGIFVGVFLNPALAIQCATSILVSACPCTLGFITPLSIKFGLSKAEALGVNFKSSKALQQADNIDIVVFDLNGTLTTGKPTVNDHAFYGNKGLTINQFFDLVSAIENESNHSFAKAISAYASTQSTNKNKYALEAVDKSNHSGIKAEFEGHRYLIGNSKFLEDYKIPIKHHFSVNGAEQIVYVVRDGHIVGHFKIEDPLRKDAQFAVDELIAMGKEIHICTGASQETAARYAGALGISPFNVHGNCVGASNNPNARSKTQYITQLQANKKRVAMVGDGGNDALAIAKSDFGVAINSTSQDLLTYENAGATIQNACLLPVVTAFAVAKQTIRSVKQNLILSLTYNMTMILIMGGLLIGIGFAINPAIGVALMIAQMALILLNQYRIYKQELPHIKRFNALHAEKEENESSYRRFKQNGLLPENNNDKLMQPEKRQSHLSIDSLRSLAPSARPQALTFSPPLTLRKSLPASSEDLLSQSEHQPLLQASHVSHATPPLSPPNCKI